ncbi:hypothetical protein NCAS_0A15140 [Naumovozyma castellii]|uniref:Uncharacterized protein n=1 Tax=Naumovozyma castellii TaxID=27288 RepID=G0V9C1_NAUCA|nr:hypothetical protein NCAS_0A15140 [Naumovozyma castellii CBS 4309]CCC68072.1 hypothetical protein NCAS_0A15140 [Naumovozyma castellii CBS 4309]
MVLQSINEFFRNVINGGSQKGKQLASTEPPKRMLRSKKKDLGTHTEGKQLRRKRLKRKGYRQPRRMGSILQYLRSVIQTMKGTDHQTSSLTKRHMDPRRRELLKARVLKSEEVKRNRLQNGQHRSHHRHNHEPKQKQKHNHSIDLGDKSVSSIEPGDIRQESVIDQTVEFAQLKERIGELETQMESLTKDLNIAQERNALFQTLLDDAHLDSIGGYMKSRRDIKNLVKSPSRMTLTLPTHHDLAPLSPKRRSSQMTTQPPGKPLVTSSPIRKPMTIATNMFSSPIHVERAPPVKKEDPALPPPVLEYRDS